MSAADLKRLTPAHKAALNAFARKHGRTWRSKLLTLREKGGYGIEGDLVHAVNVVGPSGIRAYRVTVANPGRKATGRQRNPAKKSTRLDSFTRAYIEAALWSSTDNADDSGGAPLDKNYDASDIAAASLAKMKRDCAKFQRENENAIAVGDDSQAGHDFWLTRTESGVGFWDGDWPEPEATELTEAAEGFGNVDLYVGDDGKIHESGAGKRARGRKVKAGRKTATRKKVPSRKVANPRKRKAAPKRRTRR